MVLLLARLREENVVLQRELDYCPECEGSSSTTQASCRAETAVGSPMRSIECAMGKATNTHPGGRIPRGGHEV